MYLYRTWQWYYHRIQAGRNPPFPRSDAAPPRLCEPIRRSDAVADETITENVTLIADEIITKVVAVFSLRTSFFWFQTRVLDLYSLSWPL